jgi:CRISPR-associated protein Cas2
MRWVIAYDISQDRTRRRIAKRLEQLGFRRQKSVFEGEASPKQIQRLLDSLAELIDLTSDVLTVWPTGENGPAHLQHRGVPRDEVRKDWEIV